MSLTEAQFQQQQPVLLNEKHQEIIQDIQKLQEIEKYMFHNLEKATGQGGNSTAQDMAINKINDLTQTRINLFSQLKDVYSNTQNELNDDRNVLANQIAMTKMVENELNNLKNNTEQLRSNKSNKLRLVEIGEYESKRYNAHIGIMKIITACSIIILIASVLHKSFPIPAMVTTSIIILTLSVSIIMIILRVLDLMRRNNMNYDQYDFGGLDKAQMQPGYETVLEHDKAFFSKIGGEIESEYNKESASFSKAINNFKNKVSGDASNISNMASNALNEAKQAISNSSNAVPNQKPTVESLANYASPF